ncbi:MAG: efflux transporter outer membrane subunit [Acidobacteriota bacterium]
MSSPAQHLPLAPGRALGPLAAALLVAALASGCVTVGPDYAPPETPQAPRWSVPADGPLAAGPVADGVLVTWWQALDDPVLSDLIERALADSPDLAAARARLDRVRALLRSTETDRLPTVDASGSVISAESSAQTSAPGQAGTGNRVEIYRAALDASWELDLFGRVRRSVEAAVADLEGAAADLGAVRVSLVAEVATTYVDLRTFEARLALAEDNLAAQQGTFDLASERFDAGLAGRLDVEQARSNLATTRSQIPPLRTGLAGAKNRLAVLTGAVPGSFEAAAAEERAGAIPLPPAEIAIGIPAEALRRRPDVLAAERRVAAETARIGVATAELYPRFALSGSIGVEALDLDGLFDSGSPFSTFGPSFSWRLFDRRAVRAGIAAQTATQEEALSLYRSTVLLALEESENALVSFAQERLRLESLRAAVAATEKTTALAEELYRSGLRDFQQVLDAQRSLLALEDQRAESEGRVTQNLVALYKSLGGGWTPLPRSSNPEALPDATSDEGNR